MSDRPERAGGRNAEDGGIQLVQPTGWPRGAGYAHGTAASGRMVFTAGQIGWDPATRKLVSNDFAAQATQALTNAMRVLAAAGALPHHVTRMTWYITERDAYLAAHRELGAAWRELCGTHYPAMSVIVVAGLLETGALIEIEATAVIPG